MKKTLKAYLVLLTLISAAACQPIRTVKVTVIGDDQQPIKDAKVLVGFVGDDKGIEGLTDENGVFEASSEQPLLRMLTRVNKEGYYETEKDRLRKDQDHELTLVLREKKNPIPLYARKFRAKIPGIDKAYGLDLKMGDWVAPHGKGQNIDLFFEVTIVENKDGKLGGKLEITFPNKSEGVFEVNVSNGYLPLSEMKMPHLAPLEPYEAKIDRIEFGYQNENKSRNTSYFFRTQETENSKGELLYHYSKFLSGIDFYMGGGRFLEEPSRSKYPDEYGAVDFVYYFNPNLNDRNLEFDPSQNLMKGLDVTEKVHQP